MASTLRFGDQEYLERPTANEDLSVIPVAERAATCIQRGQEGESVAMDGTDPGRFAVPPH